MRPYAAATPRCMCGPRGCWRNWRSAAATGAMCAASAQLARIGLLVLDDFLLTPPSIIEAKDLLEVIDDRSQVRSTLVVSQLPVENWHPALAAGDPTLADAILDRLVHNAHRLALKGSSMRRRQPEEPPSSPLSSFRNHRPSSRRRSRPTNLRDTVAAPFAHLNPAVGPLLRNNRALWTDMGGHFQPKRPGTFAEIRTTMRSATGACSLASSRSVANPPVGRRVTDDARVFFRTAC